jgi:hypothetical protein
MRKMLLTCLLALSTAGCATFQNPVSTSALYDAEAAYGVAISAAVAYRGLCANRQIPPSCRTVVPKLQAADRQVQVAIQAANTLARAGDTVNIGTAVATVQSALASFQALEANNGVK